MIYFIRSGQYVKIGRANSPLARLRQVQTGNPLQGELLAVLPGGRNSEARLHSAFAEYRVRGEWFQLVPAIEEFITDARRDHPECQLTPQGDETKIPKTVGGEGRRHVENLTLQDWLDIVWQSAIQARDKGLDIQFVDLGTSVGIRVFGVVVRDGRPYLTTTVEVAPERVEGHPDGGANAAIVDGQSV